MRRIIFILAVALPLVFIGCEKDKDENESNLKGMQYTCNGNWSYYTLRLEFISEKEARFYFSGTQSPKSTTVNYIYTKENETIIFNNASFQDPDNTFSYYIKSGEFFSNKRQLVIHHDWKFNNTDNLFQDYDFNFNITK
jgi:hypothetical protein